MRVCFAVLLALFLAVPPAVAETVQPAVPIDRPAPDYPALSDEVEGYVKLHFTIGKDGHVKDAAHIESSPPGVFDAAAIAGMAQWSYKPRTVDGVAADQPDNTILLRFKPSPDQPAALLNPAPPFYPKKAFDQKLEGKVTVKYDIDELGLTDNVTVVASESGIFDKAAIINVQQRVFRPRTIDGVPQKVTDVTTAVEFKLSEVRFSQKSIEMSPPKFPADAASRVGYCVIYFMIEPNGSVSNPVVIASHPRGVFDKAVLDAIKTWKYESPGDHAVPMNFTFKFAERGHKISEMYYLKPGQWVKLNFTINPSGRASDITVLDSSDASIDTDKAIKQIRNTRFTPHMENGTAVTQVNQTMILRGPTEQLLTDGNR